MIDALRLDPTSLANFLSAQPWFRARRRAIVEVQVLEAPIVRESPPRLAIAIAEVGFPRGTQEIYQLPLGIREPEDGWLAGGIASLDGSVVYDALADPELAEELFRLIGSGASVRDEEAAIDFVLLDGAQVKDGVTMARTIETLKSASRVVLDEELVLKVYRRLEPGVNPELELFRFLGERGFPNAPRLYGWYAHSGRLIDATLGILREYVPAECDGWTSALDSISGSRPEFLDTVERLGEVAGSLHVLLASEPNDPAFAPEEPSVESLGLLAATLDEEIEELFGSLPDEEVLEPIAGRGEEVRERLRLLSRMGSSGRVIRLHGDFHLSEVLWNGNDWLLFDFEGETGRKLADRRRKGSPLRDVASMLRSFAYAAAASELTRGVAAPLGWEERARSDFLAAYFAQVEPSGLIPGGRTGTEMLLQLFELEKAVSELRFELENRPDWVPIPVAAIQRLLETPVTVAT